MWCWRSYRKSAMFWIIEESWRTWSSPLHLSGTICRSCWTDVPDSWKTPSRARDTLQDAVDKLRASFAILPSKKHSRLKGTIVFPEYRILRNHPRLIVKYGRSSEDGLWWAESRDENGKHIAASKGWKTLP